MDAKVMMYLVLEHIENHIGDIKNGINILPDDKILMEVKCNGGMPLWLTSILSQEKI